MSKEFITNEIKSKKVIYYLTSKNDIESIKQESISANIFLALFSLAAGGALTIYLTRELSENLSANLISKLNIFLVVLPIISIIFFIFFLIASRKNFKTIKEIISYGAYNVGNTSLNTEVELKIMEAYYFSENVKKDVTKKLQEMVENNFLSGNANNETFGDPEHGKDKWLRIIYTLNGEEYTKEYQQGEAFQLPPNKSMKV